MSFGVLSALFLEEANAWNIYSNNLFLCSRACQVVCSDCVVSSVVRGLLPVSTVQAPRKMTTKAADSLSLDISSWLAELHMECYKKPLEDYQTIKVCV